MDQHGKIAAVTEARNITPAALLDLLAEKSISLPLVKGVSADLEWDKATTADQIEPLLQIILKPSNALTGGLRPQPGRVTADGVTLLAMITWAYDLPLARVVSYLPASAQPYKLSVVVPPGREELLRPLLQQALETSFGFKTRRTAIDLPSFARRANIEQNAAVWRAAKAIPERSFPISRHVGPEPDGQPKPKVGKCRSNRGCASETEHPTKTPAVNAAGV